MRFLINTAMAFGLLGGMCQSLRADPPLAYDLAATDIKWMSLKPVGGAAPKTVFVGVVRNFGPYPYKGNCTVKLEASATARARSG